MTQAAVTASLFDINNAKTALNGSVKAWFAVAMTGQIVFALYIIFVYTLTLFFGLDIAHITPTQGYDKANGFDFLVFFTHILPAAYLSLFGMLQLVPAIRVRFRRFHRWNGRIFLILGFSGALTGLYLQWITGLRLSNLGSVGITLNGLLILFAVYQTWRHAISKRFELHMRWAIHTFFLVNAVWSFRLFLMGWYMVNQGPNGNTGNVDGPVDIFFSFACYLIPMAVAELYFWANRQQNARRLWTTTIVVSIGALVTLTGVIAGIMMMWWPRIAEAIALL